jgi:hypothetical protein
LKRVSKYNLSDGEEDEDDIHHSRTLLGNDDFDEEVPLGDDSDEEGVFTFSSKYLILHYKQSTHVFCFLVYWRLLCYICIPLAS